MIDAYRNGMDVYRVGVFIEILAQSRDEAVDYVDRKLIVDRIVNDPRFVSFNITTPYGEKVAGS